MQPSAYVAAELQAKLLAAAPSELELSFRPMFGGIMGHAHGRPFASLSNVGLAFKLTGADHAAAMALPGACPLRYEPDSPPSRSYVLMPDQVLDDPAQLAAWAERCSRYVAAQPTKKPRKFAPPR